MNDKIQKLINSIENFKNLKFNWDSYNADPVPVQVIEKSIKIVKQLWEYNVYFNYVFPGNDKYIQFESDSKSNHVDLEVHEDKLILTTYNKKSDILEVKSITDLIPVRNILNLIINDIKF